MEEASISHSPSGLSRRTIGVISGDNQTSLELSSSLSPSEGSAVLALPVPSKETGENLENGSGNLAPGEQSHGFFQQAASSCRWKSNPDAVLFKDMQETEGDCVLDIGEGDSLYGAVNGNPKEESSGSDIPEVRDIQRDGGSGGAANGITKQEATGFKVLGAASGELSQKIDAVGGDFRCSLEIELIDDTAVIDLSTVGIELETPGTVSVKRELEPEKEKKPRRRTRAAKKDYDENKSSSNLRVSAGNSTVYKRTEKGTKIVYSRKAMEALRYFNVKGQKRLWQEIYNAFSPAARTEYEELGSFRHQNKQSGLSCDTNRAPAVLGELCKEIVHGDFETPVPVECTCDDNYIGEDDVDDEESNDSYNSIQRPAFLVEGEPDFDSGPPEDGLEYLKRVRWEAAQIPNVKVAKLDKCITKKEQSVYMPEIPVIARCPEHLLPLKQWEEEFLSDFSELRLAICRLDGSPITGSSQMVEASDHSSGPTLTAILKMDFVARVNMLKRRISLFESKDEASQNECLWLFSLCASIDTPLDADTSASLRALLRKCSKLRANKTELDDEAVMLNILVTISGKYFGQAEN